MAVKLPIPRSQAAALIFIHKYEKANKIKAVAKKPLC
jgi:hypothetical protein